MNMLKKIQNKNIVRTSIVAAVMLISTVLSNIVTSNAAVETVVPPGATMDVFDYYVMGKNTDQNYECYSHPEIATNGINAGKQLKFLYNNAVRNHSYDATTAKWMRSVVNDYVNNNDYSFVNNIGYGNPKVDSSGYPHVVDPGRIDTSIGYLFDSSSQNGKISYMNATPNIFKKTSDGSYSYNSYDNFARFDTGKKTFALESKAGGGFFPFDSISTDYLKSNHYFGMHVTQPFYLPANLKTETGKDIVFQFNGDDDVYIDIDGAVISLNIFLAWHGCTINFSTGTISTDTAGYKADYTLKDLFTRAGITPTGGFSGNTLAGDTYHTLNFYYLERGNWGSNCILKYNIQTKPLTVSYNGNGSDTGDGKDVASHVDESMRIDNNWFGKTGYDFKEWNTKADGTGASYKEGDETAFTEDTTLYAIWTPRTYTIAFDSNSTDATGSMSPMPMTYDVGKALTSNSFSRIGYKFIGWRSSDAATGKEYADGATVSNLTSTDKATVTMYAQWQPISYTVKFDKNKTDATGSMPDMSFKYNETKRLTPNVYSSASAKFAGIWNTRPNGSGTTYQDGESVTNLTEENGGTVTLYAQWSTNSYIVTFIDGHDGTTLKTENVEHGHAATPPTMPQHTGYTPLGWSGYGNITGNTVIRLEYRKNTYQIAFDANGGTGSMGNQQMSYDTKAALNANKFSRTGYTYVGWRLEDKDNGTAYADGEEVENLTSEDGATLTMYAQWSSNGYDILFNANAKDATGATPSMHMSYGETRDLTKNGFSRTGYIFSGWRLSDAVSGTEYADGASVTNLSSASNGSVTLYAQWTPISYRIRFDGNKADATGSTPEMSMRYGETKSLSLNGFSSPSAKWLGWNAGVDGTGSSYSNGQDVRNLTAEDGGTVTLYAQWSTNSYTVTFIDGHDGKTLKQESVKYGGAATAPDAPDHEGYTSTHWDKRFDNVTSNITVILEYIANEYTINFDGNGATSGNMQPLQMQYDKEKNLTANAFAREGYTWAGWNTKAGGNGTGYTDKQAVRNLTSENNGSVTLYAQWTPIAYRIQFDKNLTDATGETASMGMTFGVAKNLTENGFTSPSSKFNCWNSKPDGSGQAYANGQSVKNLTKAPNDIVTLYAQWSTNSYTVTFVDGHDGMTISTARVRHGADAIPPTKPHHDGYTATGWEGDYSGVTEDRTVTLAYRANRYRIAFDANGGSGTIPNQHLEYGKKSNLSENVFTRTGYSFAGWRLENKGNGTRYSDGQEILNLTDIDDGVLTMYAQWTPHSYTIRYDANGGKGSIADQRMTYDKADKLKANAFTRNGYTWAGWRRDDSATGAQYRNRQEVKNLLPDDGGSTTIYAQWMRNTYTVTFIDGLDGATIGTVGAEYGQRAEAPTAPSHTGYTPSGWDTDFSNVTGDMTVTMGYRANRYRIEFDKNSVRASGSTAGMQLEYGKPANLTRNGFSLDGHDWLYWTDDADGNGRQYSDTQSVTDLTADDGATVTLYAQWKIRRYTVTFIDGMTGDVISRTEVEHGGKAAAPAIPKHSGYKATDWSKPFGSVTGNIETSIGYEPIRYTVAFDGNSAEAVGSMPKMGMSYGKSKALAANAFSRPGYRFIGWGLKPEGEVSFNDCGTVENLTDVDGATVTLYAQWVEKDSVHIGYKASPADGGTVSNDGDTLNPETGEAKGSKAEAATGYRFIGWYSGDTKVSGNSAFIPVKPAGGWRDSSYEARFEKMRFTVSFVGKDGEELKEEEVEYGDGATAPDAPHVEGYEFIGWDRKFDNVTEDITVKALYRELPISPAPVAPTAPEPMPEPKPSDDGVASDLMQTGVETASAAVAMAIGTVSAAAVAVAVRRKR